MTDEQIPGLIRITPEVADQLAAKIKPALDDLAAIWEREGPAAEAAFAETGATMDWIGGNCPVQAEGTVDSMAFYFRARGSRWTFTVAERQAAIFEAPTFHCEAPYGDGPYDAGWMPKHHAYAAIIEGIRLYRLERELRDAHERQGNGGDFLEWVRAMAADDRGTLQEAAKSYLTVRA